MLKNIFLTISKKLKKINWIWYVLIGIFALVIMSSNIELFSGVNENSENKDVILGDMSVDSTFSNSNEFMPNFDTSESLDVAPKSIAVSGESKKIDIKTTEKLVYTAQLELRTKDLKESIRIIKARLKKYNGIISGESYYVGGYNGNTVELSLRIPQEYYEEFLNNIDDSTGISIKSLEKVVSNLTDIYTDNVSKLKSLRVQETRLLEFMKSAKTVEEMLNIESKLADIQYKIETFENSQIKIDNDVAYSTLNMLIIEAPVTVIEEKEPRTFIERLGYVVSSSAKSFLSNLENLLYLLIILLPYLVIIFIVILIIRVVIIRVRKRRIKK